MLTVDDYGAIRRAHRDGLSIREIALTFHHSRYKIREILQQAEPVPGLQTRDRPAPVLGPLHAIIDQILAEDEHAPPKQRHTAKQLFRRLGHDHGYTGCYGQVQRYVLKHRRRHRDTFIPLAHLPGRRLEADFGHIHVDFPDGRRPIPFLVTVWAYSNYPFVIALPTERTEAILGGMVAAFEFFATAPREVWWDNPKTVAKLIFKGRRRELHPRYAALASHYAFDPRFCLPAHGNEKPDAEGTVKAVQRRFATPVPRVAGFDELNRRLRRLCLAERERIVESMSGPFRIGDRFAEELAVAGGLPQRPFDACIEHPAVTVDKYQTVTFDRNQYSVPRDYAFHIVAVKGYVDRVVIVAGGQVVASHPRHYERCARCSTRTTIWSPWAGGRRPWTTRRCFAIGTCPRLPRPARRPGRAARRPGGEPALHPGLATAERAPASPGGAGDRGGRGRGGPDRRGDHPAGAGAGRRRGITA